eukprot:CAMPEP_0195538646 /NCGR_PEP_ID=MMETSP0794_2-20130614/49646_1 /TAXON_ID=515487 /ORGANISM="Stephanopyxis turris, Strain CCMP 815" /LENGTH=98 /DNA_ID=CAMNT_0040672651 /DNA_START=226 /DNA_END=522 /DNA_ORIENTATION=-
MILTFISKPVAAELAGHVFDWCTGGEPIAWVDLTFISKPVAAELAGHVFDWCTGGEPIAWVDPAKEAVSEKIAAGAKLAPNRDEDGKIEDLKGFHMVR